jgi:hypothetical protein
MKTDGVNTKTKAIQKVNEAIKKEEQHLNQISIHLSILIDYPGYRMMQPIYEPGMSLGQFLAKAHNHKNWNWDDGYYTSIFNVVKFREAKIATLQLIAKACSERSMVLSEIAKSLNDSSLEEKDTFYNELLESLSL